MKRILFLLLIVAVSCTPKVNREVYSDHEAQTIMIGEVNWEGLIKPPYGDWFKPNYLNYQVDSVSLATIEDKLEGVEIVVFMGTWCEDSQVEVPQFYKILDHLGYNLNDLTVSAIDRSDDGIVLTPKATEHNIEKVPTYIFYRHGIELGRITEYPVKSLEKDMAEILGGIVE